MRGTPPRALSAGQVTDWLAQPDSTDFAATVLRTRPLQFYRLNEPSGTVAADSAGLSLADGTIVGATLGQASIVPSDSSAASIVCDSTDHFYAPVARPAGSPFTIMVAHKYTSTSTIAVWRDQSSTTGNILYFNTTYVLVRFGGTDYTTTVLRSDVEDGDPHLLIVTYAGTGAAAALYMDSGAPAWTEASAAASTVINTLYVGKNGGSTGYRPGYYSEVGIWTRALTASDVTDICRSWTG